MKKTIITTLILVIISVSIYILQVTVGFPPSDATGSAIKGVQKANKYKIEDDTEVELVGEEFQIFLQNDELQEMLQDKDLNDIVIKIRAVIIVFFIDLIGYCFIVIIIP